MPLQNKQPFCPNPIPDNLDPNDGVFYHELTNEIFTTHDAYFDRFLFCNSLVWTCCRTGKSGLTFKEALDSERAVGEENGFVEGSPKKKRKRDRSKNNSNDSKTKNNNKRPAPSSSDEANTATGEAKEKKPRKRTKVSDKSKPPTLSSEDKADLNESANDDNDDGSKGAPQTNGDGSILENQPVKKKKKKYPYDPKKYSMPVPDGFDPTLLTPTGKIDGRKLKSKKNEFLAKELLLASGYEPKTPSPSKTGSLSKKEKAKQDEARRKEEEARKKEEEIKKKARLQAELAKERELEAKKKKEAAALARQLERQKKEDERKKAAAFLQNWEKKCEDLERDDLRRLPQPTPVNCDIPERLFGDSIFIMEAIYNFHDLYNFSEIYPEGLGFDTLEEILIDKHEEGALGNLLIFLLRTIFHLQPTQDGYGLDDDSKLLPQHDNTNQISDTKDNSIKALADADADDDTHGEYESNGTGGSENGEDDNDENSDKYVNMNDRIGSAIKAAQEVKKTFSKPLPDMEITSSNVTEILRLHLLQSGSFPKGRTIYNGWYSSREDPGLWLCMQEPDLIKKLGEFTVYDLEIDERIKILHTLINQLLTFIKSRLYMEAASDQLLELRKQYRKEAADFARWDRENCVKRMQPPKRKDQPASGVAGHEENQNSHGTDQQPESIKSEPFDNDNHRDNLYLNSNQPSECGDDGDEESSIQNQRLKSCLKSNGTSDVPADQTDLNATNSKSKKITFKSGLNGEMNGNGHEIETDTITDDNEKHNEEQAEQSHEEMERAYEQNKVDYEDYQRERAIRSEELNETLLTLRTQLRQNQSVYAIHPVGRDRSYKRYWLFQSLPGLFIEQDDEYVGECLPQPTPLESRYKKLFGKDNPLMHPNEADLIRPKTCDVACSTDSNDAPLTALATNEDQKDKVSKATIAKKEPNDSQQDEQQTNHHNNNNNNNSADVKDENQISSRLNGNDRNHDAASEHDGELNQDGEDGVITDEMNYCTGDKATCYIHGPKRLTQRWWFYHTPDSIDSLIESLNKRGYRECELHDVLSAESSIIKPRVAECPAYKLNKLILEQSGIRRSRRLRTKTGKRRGRNYD